VKNDIVCVFFVFKWFHAHGGYDHLTDTPGNSVLWYYVPGSIPIETSIILCIFFYTIGCVSLVMFPTIVCIHNKRGTVRERTQPGVVEKGIAGCI
jgi:hypothetical protein